MEEMPEADVLRTFYDGAESTTQFISVTNVKIVKDDSDSFLGDKARMARKCGFYLALFIVVPYCIVDVLWWR